MTFAQVLLMLTVFSALDTTGVLADGGDGGDGGGFGHLIEGLIDGWAHCTSHSQCQHGDCVPSDDVMHHYTCRCKDGYTGFLCDTAPTPVPRATTTAPTLAPTKTTSTTSTLAPTTTTTSTSAPTTTTTSVKSTTQPPVQLHSTLCRKLGTISQIANQVKSRETHAAACASGNHTSPEAFTLGNCNLPMPGFWKKGDNVVNACASGSIQPYTPVAHFDPAGYTSSSNKISGVFLGCETQPGGFKLALQRCDSFPTIEHVSVGTHSDPNAFHVIVY